MTGHERPPCRDATMVVVGASLAGLRAAEEIRHEGHAGPVIIVGDELHAPYDRPPLSKQLLAGTWEVDRIHHHAPDALDTLGLEFRLGRRAAGLDLEARTRVTADDGDELRFDGLIVATGAPPGPCPAPRGIAPCPHPAHPGRLPGHPAGAGTPPATGPGWW